MDQFSVYSDSACDLPAAIASKYGIGIIPLKISFDRINKMMDGVDITSEEFYQRLKTETQVPKTYFPSVREYVDVFKKELEQEHDLLCLCLSSKLSKSYQNACLARDILSYTYKDKYKIVVLDSLQAAGGQATLALNAARLRDAGYTVEAAGAKLAEQQASALTLFTVSSLEQLARGGRMSRATATMGKLLHINPIIFMEDGALVSREKAIGRAKALDKMKKLIAGHVK